MGSVEGSIDSTVLVPPVAGPVLFVPARFHGTYLNPVHHWVPNDAWARALTRAAYDETSLARALREGLDPDGKRLIAPMPRYDLDAPAVSALAAYLRTLSARPAPGVEHDALHLATVVTPDAPPDQVDAVVGEGGFGIVYRGFHLNFEHPIAITARQLESLVRMAEARARAHLRDEVTIEDAESVINLMQKSLEQVGVDVTTGQIDIDILYTGKPRSLQNQLTKVLQVIGEMERVSGSVKETDLYEALSTDYGINRTEGARLISVLMKDGTIYMPRPGYYRRTD